MKIVFRLAELLNYLDEPGKRAGMIGRITQHTGLDRHLISGMLRNSIKTVSLDKLASLCRYLVEHENVSPDILPGALFRVEAEDIWSFLADHKRLEVCMGIRVKDGDRPHEESVLGVSDAYLSGQFLAGLSTLGGTVEHLRRERELQRRAEKEQFPADPRENDPAEGEENNDRRGTDEIRIPHPENIIQSLVWSPTHGPKEDAAARPLEVFEGHLSANGSRVLVCVGSSKSNSVGDHVLGITFGTEPLVSQDDVEMPSDRSCPFYLLYRSFDPDIPSCAGGRRLSKQEPGNIPGIWFEQRDGSWTVCPCVENESDAALVFYHSQSGACRVEIILAGFSGRATRLLGRTLMRHAADLWPPTYIHQGHEIGAFIIEYRLKSAMPTMGDAIKPEPPSKVQIHRIHRDVIARRVDPLFRHGT